MKLYEIINPSDDPYTLKAPSFEVATAAVLVLGEGAYGLQGITDESEQQVPVGAQEWRGLEPAGRCPFYGSLSAPCEEVCAALNSVHIGSARERTAFDRAMSGVQSVENRRAAWAQYNDKKRSSLNDIGTKAKRLARELDGDIQ